MPHRSVPLTAIVLFALGACSSDPASPPAMLADAGSAVADAGPSDGGIARRIVIGGARPARAFVPSSYDGTTPMPLIVLLHGYGIDGASQDAYWGISRRVDADGFFLVVPDGTVDSRGRRFWNATAACCDLDHVGVDDVGYLRGLVAEMKTRFMIDAARVYFTGHSNGAFMSHRMACEDADEVTAIVALAGVPALDPAACAPSRAVSVLHVHGTADDTIAYDGRAGAHPGAIETADRWATLDGCTLAAATDEPPLDLDTTVAGDETRVRSFQTGCSPGTEVALWSMDGAGHAPAFSSGWGARVTQWLLAHRR